MMHPVHGVVLEIGGVRHVVRSNFKLARDIEEQIGSVFDLAQSVITRSCSVTKLADILQLVVPGASPSDIEWHFDEVGIAGVVTELASIFAQLLKGFKILSDEAGVTPANPPQAEGKAKAGRPRGARNKPKSACPGETSSEPPAASASCQENSGEQHRSSLPPSGQPQNYDLPQRNDDRPQTTVVSSITTRSPTSETFLDIV